MKCWRILTSGSKDIATCQQKGKTILLSIGGATYSEGGFKSNSDAQSGAQLIWETFGPKQEGSKALRPFGDVSLDGFDFDFEANVMHMAAFAQELRSLMDNDTTKQYFLTAAPQCPYPDLSDKDILNGPIYMDAVWVQFYNNFCGVNNFNSDPNTSKYNFDQWDNWAKTVSKNPNVKVLLGVPADTTAASTGYIPADQLATVIDYSKKFASFGGVMMWDATQAEANNGFIQAVRNALGGGGSGSSSSSNSASTAASAPSSTNLPNTSGSSNSLGSPSSSSSSSGSGSSSSGPDHPAPDAHPKSAPNHTGNPSPKPQPETAPTSKPTTASSSKHSAPKPHKPHATNSDSGSDSSKHTKEPVTGVNNTQKGAANNGVAHNLLSTNLFGLLNGLRQANSVPTAITGAIHGITQNLRRVNRFKY